MLLLPFQPQPGAPPVAESANMDAFGVTGNFYEVLQSAHRQQGQTARASAPPADGDHTPSLASLMATILNDTRIRLQSPAQPPVSTEGEPDFSGAFTRDMFSEAQETDAPVLNLLDASSETDQTDEHPHDIARQVQNAQAKSAPSAQASHHPVTKTTPQASPVMSGEIPHREEVDIQADVSKTDRAPGMPLAFRGKTEAQSAGTKPIVTPDMRDTSPIVSQSHSPDTAPASAINANGNHTPVRRAPLNTSTDHAQVSSASPTWPVPPMAVNPAQPADTSEYIEEGADVNTENNAQVQPNIAHPSGASFQPAASPQHIQTEAKAEHTPSLAQTAAKPGLDHGATPKPAGHSESVIGETGAPSRSATGGLNMRPAFDATTAQPIAEPEAQTLFTNPVARPGANRTPTTQNRPTPDIGNAEGASVRTPEGQLLHPPFNATTAQPAGNRASSSGEAGAILGSAAEGQHVRPGILSTGAQPTAEPEAQTPSLENIPRPVVNRTGASAIDEAGATQTAQRQHADATLEQPLYGRGAGNPSADIPVAGFDRSAVGNVAQATPSVSSEREGRSAFSVNSQPNPPAQQPAETDRDPVSFTAPGTGHQASPPDAETRVWSDAMANQSSVTLDRSTANRTVRTTEPSERTPMFSTASRSPSISEQGETSAGLPLTEDAPIPITGPPVPDVVTRNTPGEMPAPAMPEMRIDSGAPARSANAPAPFQLQDASPEQIEHAYRVTDQIIRSARAFTRDGATEITLRLDPPELGEVTIRLSNRNQMISGEIAVENQKVHDIVQRHMGALRESLSGQGIQIDQLDVSVDDRSAFDREAARQFAEDQSRSNHQRERPQSESQRDMAEPRVRPRADGHVDYMA